MGLFIRKYFITFFLLNILFLVNSYSVQNSPQSFTFQGRLYNAAGTDAIEEPVTLKFQIYNPSANCLLYQESQTIDLTNTQGLFSVSIGSATGAGKRTAGVDPGFTMTKVFKNDPTTQTRVTHATCPGGYTPTSGDTRVLRVTVTPQSGIPEVLSPDQVINSVPHALVAETLQGLLPTDFVQKDPIYVTDEAIKKLFGSLVDGVVDASDLHTHDDLYVKISNTNAQEFGSGGFNNAGKASVGIASHFTTTTMSVKADADTNIGLAVRANSGSQSADLFQVQNSAGTKLAGISATGVLSATTSTLTSTAGNQFVVKYDVSNMQTLDVSSDGTSTFTAAGSSPKFGFLGGDIGIGTSSPSRALHVTSASAPTVIQENTSAGADEKKRYSTTSTSGDMAWGKFSDDMSTTTEHMRLLSNGNLGLGVVSPTAFLHLKAGTATANTAPLKFNSGVLLTTPENGSVEYDGTDYYTTSGGVRKKIAYSATIGDFTSVSNSSGALTVSAGGTNQNLTLAASGTGSVTVNGNLKVGIGTVGTIYSEGYIQTASKIFLNGQVDWANNALLAVNSSEKMRILSNGNVGIGTTSPSNILSIGGTAARTIGLERNTTSATAGQGLTLSSGGSIAGTSNLAGGDLNLSSGISTGTGTSSLRFFTATAGISGTTDNTPTEKMTILGSGKVGIGATNPSARLEVVSGTLNAETVIITQNQATNVPTLVVRQSVGGGAGNSNVGLLVEVQGQAASTNSIAEFRDFNSGTPISRMVIQKLGNVGIGLTAPYRKLEVFNGRMGFNSTAGLANTMIGSIEADNSFRDGRNVSAASIDFFSGSSWSTGEILFKTNSSDSTASYATERMRITAGGNVGIGNTGSSYKLDVTGDIRASGCLISSAGTASGTCTSDARLKKDVTLFKLGLKELIGVNPVEFRFNGLAGTVMEKEKQLGVIAQDVEKVAPSLIVKELVKLSKKDKVKTEIKKVNYTAFMYMLINSVKELNKRITGLWEALEGYSQGMAAIKAANLKLHAEKDKEIAKLAQENADMKSRLERLEKLIESQGRLPARVKAKK